MGISSSVRCVVALAGGLIFAAAFAQDEVLIIGREGNRCAEDTACFNRLHPEIPMAARAEPGQTIVFKTRNAGDSQLDPESNYVDSRGEPPYITAVHPPPIPANTIWLMPSKLTVLCSDSKDSCAISGHLS